MEAQKELSKSWRWRVELFGGLRLLSGRQVIVDFPTHQTAALLAMLAYADGREIPRCELATALWPETDAERARRSLNTAVCTLRQILEPPGAPTGSILLSSRSSVRIHPRTVETDVIEFERLVQRAKQCENLDSRLNLLTPAVENYRARILPGFGEVWIRDVQAQADNLYSWAVKRLAEDLAIVCPEEALCVIYRALAIDPDQLHLRRLEIAVLTQMGRLMKARQAIDTLVRDLEKMGIDPRSEREKLLEGILRRSPDD